MQYTIKDLFIALATCYLVVGTELIGVGNIFISKIENNHTKEWLLVENNRLVRSEHLSTFEYDPKGFLEWFHHKLYLNVNEEGKVVLSREAKEGFLLTPDSSSQFNQKISYNHQKVFQLCGDGSIGFNSQCEGARKIALTYEELFH